MRRNVLGTVLVLALLSLSVGCSGEGALRVEPQTTTVRVGETVGFTAAYRAPGISGCMSGVSDVTGKALWTVDSKEPATASMSFAKPGQYRVIADYMGTRGMADVTVIGAEETSGGDVAMSTDEIKSADPATLERIFLSGNIAAVYNGGTPVTWTLSEKRRIREIWTYHWNDAKGTSGGGTVTLEKADGTKVGSWKVARMAEGQGGVPNAYWIAEMDITLPAGTYVIKDSDPSTWAQNSGTGGVGHAWVMATKK